MKKDYLLLLIMLLVLAGCGGNSGNGTAEADGDVIVIDANTAFKEDARYLDDMVESVEVIKLETSEESILGHLLKCIVTDKRIFVSDVSGHKTGIAMFGRDGRFIKRFTTGGGEHELPFIFGMCYYGDALYVYGQNKVIKYSNDGEYVKAYHCEDGFTSSIRRIGDRFVTQKSGIMDKEYTVNVYDTNFVKNKELSLGPVVLPLASVEFNCIGDTSLVSMAGDNNIYVFADDSLKVRYRLDYHDYEYHFPPDKYTSLPFEELLNCYQLLHQDLGDNEKLFLGTIQEVDDYLVFSFSTKQFEGGVYYSKKTGKTWRQKHNSDVMLNVLWQTDGSQVFGVKNAFCATINIEHFLEYFLESLQSGKLKNPYNLFSQNDIEALKKSTPEDNPFVVIYKLKDNL